MYIYVASSWRNVYQPSIVVALRALGHTVYDFREPDGPGSSGFSWKEVARKCLAVGCSSKSTHGRYGAVEPYVCKDHADLSTAIPIEYSGGAVAVERYREMLEHPIAAAGYANDIKALKGCDAVVYVLPCGRSASWEFGYAMGQGRIGVVAAFEAVEPDLMFREAPIAANMKELTGFFSAL